MHFLNLSWDVAWRSACNISSWSNVPVLTCFWQEKWWVITWRTEAHTQCHLLLDKAQLWVCQTTALVLIPRSHILLFCITWKYQLHLQELLCPLKEFHRNINQNRCLGSCLPTSDRQLVIAQHMIPSLSVSPVWLEVELQYQQGNAGHYAKTLLRIDSLIYTRVEENIVWVCL